MQYLTNARAHDIWKILAFSVAEVGILAMAWFPKSEATETSEHGVGFAAFVDSATIKIHKPSLGRIADYEEHLMKYAALV